MSITAVYGIYPSRMAAEKGVSELKAAGFGSSDVSVLFAAPTTSAEFAHENSTKAPEGATAGVISGATVGGIMGWLVGLGSLAIPGVGPLIAAGPIMASLAGASVGGAIGGLAGGLIGLGIPEYEAKRYEDQINRGGVLVSVKAETSEMSKRAHDVLEQTGAEDIGNKGLESSTENAERRSDRINSESTTLR